MKEKAENLKDQLQELARTATKPDGEYGRDNETINHPQTIRPVNWDKGWNKGWNKYGKT